MTASKITTRRRRSTPGTPKGVAPRDGATNAPLLLGRYQLQEEIGRGGMATVYRAVDTNLGRTVAVKLLHPQIGADPRFAGQFLSMERQVAGLSHLNLVTIYDAGVVDNRCFVVMEEVTGGSLRQALERRHHLSVPEALSLMAQVAGALDVLHRTGIVHGDVKPDNILLDGEGHAKLADFGIARMALATEATDTGGSAAYLAPEQLDLGRTDARSDVYALGLVAYELLTGRKPFEGEHWAAIATQRLVREPDPPSAILPDLSDAIDRVILRALARDPEARYPSAGAFRDALQALPAGGEQAAASERPAATGRPAEAMGERDAVATPQAPALGAPSSTVVVAPAVPVRTSPEATTAVIIAGPYARPPVPTWAATGLASLRAHLGLLRARYEPRLRALQRRNPWLLPLAAAGVLLLLVVFGFALSRALHPPHSVQVPVLAGQPIEAARSFAAQASVPLAVHEEPSETVPAGVVIRQDPAPDATIPSTHPLTVFVSAGLPPVAVPDLTNRRPDDAKQDLEAVGLTLGKTEQQEVPRAPWGTVVNQSVRPGSQVSRGSAVDVAIGIPPWTQVPSVTGKALGDAEAELQNRGLRLGEVRLEPSAGKRAGTVLSQDPAPDVRLRQDQSVSVAIAVPPPPTS